MPADLSWQSRVSASISQNNRLLEMLAGPSDPLTRLTPRQQEAERYLAGAPAGCTCSSCNTERSILGIPQVPLPGSALATPQDPVCWSAAAPLTVDASALRGWTGVISAADINSADVFQLPTEAPVPVVDTADDLTPGEESRAYIPRAVRHDWRTPDAVLSPVRGALGGEVGLDPCASTEHWLAGGEEIAVLNFHEEDDGLALDWEASLRAEGAPRTVFVNPPFNRNRDWVKKCAEEAAKGLEIILLIPARTDTRYWQSVIAESAQAICFWRGRIRFVGADAGAPFPCAFVYWGPNAAEFDNRFDAYGQVLYTNNPVTRSENE